MFLFFLEAASELEFRYITDRLFSSEVAGMHLHCKYNCINNAMRFIGFKWTLKRQFAQK